jgi:hypothetical protein
METLFSEEIYQEKEIGLEEENQRIVNTALKQYPRFFKEMWLEDGTKAAIFYNDIRIPEERKDRLPPYRYISLSKYGLTLFNSSSKAPLGLELTRKAIQLIVELSNGEEVEDLLISEWNHCIRNRINKGLIPLKKVLRSVTVTGKNVKDGVKGFYSTVSKPSYSVI